MYKLRVAIVGYGNVGRGALDAIMESPDMEIAGIVELPHLIEKTRKEVKNIAIIDSDVTELGKLDVAILAINSRDIPDIAPLYLQKGINTVDAYDVHGESLIRLRKD